MAAIALGITMSVLDTSVANVALPTIAREVNASPDAATWVINAYQLATIVTLLPFAALGERLGYRRVYLAGLVVFTAGSLACALSHTLPTLVASRIAQGIGASGIMGMNGALVRYTYPQRLLGSGVGLNALVVSAASAIAPTVAAGVLAIGSWEWLFAINVPLGLANLVLARALPASDRAQRPLDWTSAMLNAVTFGLFFIGADSLSLGGGATLLAVAEIAVAVAAGLLLWRRAAAKDNPLIPIDLMRIPIFALSVAASVASFTAYMLTYVALPFYFETALGRDPVQTGLLMTGWPAALGVAAPLAGSLSDRLPAAILGAGGLALLALGLGLLAAMPADVTTVGILWRMALCGFGFGFFQAPNNRTLLSTAPRQRAGAAGGMLAIARIVGLTSGATLAAAMFRFAGGYAEKVDLALGAVFALGAATISLLRLSPAGRARASSRT